MDTEHFISVTHQGYFVLASFYTDNAAWTQSISYLWHIRGTLCQLLFQPSHQQNAFASDALKMQTMITSVCPALGSRVQWFCTFLRFSKLDSDTWLPIGIFLEVQFKKWACFDTCLAEFAFNKKNRDLKIIIFLTFLK